jgi:hypothetical protein
MINFFKKYWLFIIINAVILLIVILAFMLFRNSPREGGVIYQIN